MSKRWLLALAAGMSLVLVLAASVMSAGPTLQTAGEPGEPIIIRWSTETEVNTAGYNVYRALDQAGPWEQINERLIPGSADPLRGGSYVFTDTNVIAGQTYWYELEEVELGGVTTRLERTQAVAQPLAGNPLSSLPCAGGMVLFGAAGVSAMGRKTRRSS